jgi:hypothetical protein
MSTNIFDAGSKLGVGARGLRSCDAIALPPRFDVARPPLSLKVRVAIRLRTEGNGSDRDRSRSRSDSHCFPRGRGLRRAFVADRLEPFQRAGDRDVRRARAAVHGRRERPPVADLL